MFDNSNGLDLTSHPRLGVLLFVVVMLAAGKHMEVLTLLRRSLRLTDLLSLILLVLLSFSVHTWNTPFC